MSWNDLVRGLLLVRLGQELGTDSPLARAVHEFLGTLLQAIR